VFVSIDRKLQNCTDAQLSDQYQALSILFCRKEFKDPRTRPRALQDRWDRLVAEFKVRGVQLTLFD
jgi:hypothetical protein